MKRIFALFFCLMLLPIAALAEEQIITITCTGDTTLGSNKRVQTKYYEASYQYYIEQNGYAWPFAGIRHLTENDDITLVNLEGVLHMPEELSTSRFAFNGPADYAKILSEGSVEIVNLANNHIGDYLQEGYDATTAALDAEGIKYCGDTDHGRELYWFDFDNDVRIGFIGLLPSYRGKNPAKVEQDFKKLKDAGCDVIIASIHAGVEGQATHSQMTDTYRKLATALGAHIVVGTHPHVPQGLWVEKGVTTFHSLGNFSFGGHAQPKDKDSAILQQQIIRNPDGTVELGELIRIPCWITSDENQIWNNYQPTPMKPEEEGYDRALSKLDGTFTGGDLVVNLPE